MANPIVSGLTNYVEQHKTGLIAKTVLGNKTNGLLNLITGVKGATSLNLVASDAVLQAASCGWNASGSTELSQRILTPVALKVNMSFCDKNLMNTYASHLVRYNAHKTDMPFEQEFTEGVVNSVNEQVEKFAWQGQSGQTDEPEGIISILSGASATTVSMASGTPAYTAIKNVYMATPAKISSKSDFAIFVSEDVFKKFIQELVSANQYHFTPSDVECEYTLPGTGAKVIAVAGLNDTANNDYIVAGRKSNIFVGLDMLGDEEDFKLWYSDDNQEFRLAIEFIMGYQVAYPDEVVLGVVAK